MRRIFYILVIALFSVFLLYSVVSVNPGGEALQGKDFLLEKGAEETGAANLVTSIYLGYRVFDTLGETIVLMTSVAGVVFLMGKRK